MKSKTCLSCRPKGGAFNGAWRGGKTKTHAGYVMIRKLDHPRASNGYVFEHILVMEDFLGRFLKKGENVHHCNGVKNDNRLENLELWTRPQPSGIRVSDAVAWAKEILRQHQTLPARKANAAQLRLFG